MGGRKIMQDMCFICQVDCELFECFECSNFYCSNCHDFRGGCCSRCTDKIRVELNEIYKYERFPKEGGINLEDDKEWWQ